MSRAVCTTCGMPLPPGSAGPCPRCLLRLALGEPRAEMPEQLGAYRILSRLGEGGMGEIYRAHDSRLGRDVAIKVLPDLLAGDPERIARFRREARLAASLNHPNVASVYGFDDDEGEHFLVMELVDGITLAERLRSGPIPVDESLAIVRQIAEGLEAAHESGIVHRDLKPGNIKLTPAGQVKILDFGLAKITDGAGDEPAPGKAAPITGHYTSPGTVFGTVPYMSPEQARGRVLDKRSDIWSLGCILYECLAGRRAFEGDTATDVVAKILERDPAWEALPTQVPARIRELVQRCLEKDVRRRVRDAGDVRNEIERALAPGPRGPTSIGAPGSRLLWGLGTLTAAIVLVWGAMAWRGGSAARGSPGEAAQNVPMHVLMNDPDVPRIPYQDAPTLAVSPDGRTIAYTGKGPEDTGNRSGLYLRRADDVRAHRLETACDKQADRQQVSDPFFSPDGRTLGFSCGSLYTVPVAGGRTTSLVESAVPLKGATWSSSGIIFAPAAKSGLVLVKEGGGPLETLTVPDPARGEVSHRWPSALPDGRHVLFTIKKEGIATFDQAEIALLDLKTRLHKTVIRDGTFARYLPSGQIVFARGATLMAVGFDLPGERVVGSPVPVTEGVMTEPASGAAQYAVAEETGTLVFVPGGADVARNELAWIDRHGAVTPIEAPPQNYHTTYVSPDGTRLASLVFGATDGVVVVDLIRRSSVRLPDRGNSSPVAWSPDGRELVYGSDHDGLAFVIGNADGSGTPRRLDLDTTSVSSNMLIAEFPEGRAAVYAGNGGLWSFGLSGAAKSRKIGDLSPGTSGLSLSPDGRWLAYASDVSGRNEIYVKRFPAGSESWQISRGGGSGPQWSRAGDEVFYLRESGPESRIFSVRVTASLQQIKAASPVELFKVPSDAIVWAVHPDGNRFVMVRNLPAEFKGDRIEAILGWSHEVASRVSGKPTDPR